MVRNKKKSAELEAARKKYVKKNNFVVGTLVLGAAVICLFSVLIQNFVAEQNQKDQSQKILYEVTETLRHNDETVKKIENEFNELNTTTLVTLDNYIDYIDIFSEFDDAHTEAEILAVKLDLSLKFNKLATDIEASTIYLIDQTGEVIVCSQPGYIGDNLNTLFSADEIKTLTTYGLVEGKQQDGTTIYGDETTYFPIAKTYESLIYYTYSCFFNYNASTGYKYFLLTSVNTSLLDKELSSIKQISTVLDGVSVGKSGFLFSLDTQTSTFSYFKDRNSHVLTGENYYAHGMTGEAVTDNYVGYQTIDGVKYYCVTEKYSSETYGDYTIIAAVVAAEELTSKITLSAIISCFVFALVSAIVVGYGMILRRDVADHTIAVEKQYTENVADDAEVGNKKFSEEEIQERVKIKIEESIENKKDRQLARINIGTRNSKGTQRYFSKYIFKKILPVIFVGIALIFGISFFSQTLMALQEAINVSQIRINDIQLTLDKNDNTSETIREYISDQYLSKSKLISYLIEEHPEYIFQFGDYDNDDIRTSGLKDEYGNIIYSIRNSAGLSDVCRVNNLAAIYVYDDNGQCIATNTADWYHNVYNDEDPRIEPLGDIISGKFDEHVEDVDFGSDDNIKSQYIAYRFHYYTYNDNGKTVYTAKANYYDPEWVGPKITKHRSTVQVEISVKDFLALFEVTKLSYILNNLHVYGEDSFFVAFDTSEDHICMYSPFASSIGKTAKEMGLGDNVFKTDGAFNGFTKVNGVEYYQTFMQFGDHYFATAIPTESIYESRNIISFYTLLFSTIFILVISALYTISSDKSDLNYVSFLKLKNAKEDRQVDGFMIRTANGETRTNSASSRYTKVLWKNKTVEQKLGFIIMGYLFAASLVIIGILIAASSNQDATSIFTYIFSGDWERGFNIFSITASLMIIILAIAITSLVKFIVKSFCGTLGARVETLGNLLVSILKYGGVLGSIFYSLYLFGFDTTSLLTSAGILTVVVGLGAQSLIGDIIAGMFIVFEGEFRVGDIVTVGDFRGQVLEIGLRTTKIQDISNNIKIFNNSAISGVLNMTKESSYAFITVGIEYGESLERVEAVLQKGFPAIKKKLPAIVEGPIYKGVLELGTSSVNIGIVAKCVEQDRVQLMRDLNREIFLLFNKNNINIPFPQVTVSYLKSGDVIDATNSDEKK